MEHTDWQIE